MHSALRRLRWSAITVLAAISVAACASGGGERAATPTTVPATRVGSEAEFRAVPARLPAGPHGTLVKYLEVPGAVDGAATYKIMYTSVSVTGSRVAVTGLAVVPTADVAPASRVVLTVGHPTTGLADACAPSASPELAEAKALGAVAVTNSWILAATDYEGLGTPGPHPYLVGISAGRSLLDAATAAAQLPRAEASKRTLIAGFSQGGHAAAWANQLAPDWAPRLDVLGTYVGAPATEIDRFLATARVLPIQAIMLNIVAGYAPVYPDADPTRYLTPRGLELLRLTETQCVDALDRSTRDVPPLQIVRPDGPTNARWLGFGRVNNPGAVAGAGPVLIAHGSEDRIAPAVLSEPLQARMCAAGDVVERRIINGGSHGAASILGYGGAVEWLLQRVRGLDATSNCAA